MGLTNVEIKYAWQLNERHYGALQGLNKTQMAVKYGEQQVNLWRRSWDVRPPEMDDDAYQKQKFLRNFLKIFLPMQCRAPNLLPILMCE